jgi:hypothetical protein
MRTSAVPIAASLLLAFAACKKQPESPPAPLPTAPPPKAAVNPQPPPPASTGTVTPTMDPSLGVLAEVTPGEMSNASQLTLGLQEFMGEKGRVPKDMKELATFMRFRVEPIPPAGTKFVFDEKNKQVRIVRQ